MMRLLAKTGCSLIFLCFTLTSHSQWISKSNGLNSGVTHCFVETPAGLLSGGNGDGIFISNDFGDSWTSSNSGIVPGSEILCFGKHTAGIFAGSDSLIYFSNNNGASWNIVNNSGYAVFAFALLNDTVFAATRGGGVVMSTDTGVSWTSTNTGITTLSVLAIIAKGNLLFAGTENDGIFKSSNSGITWTPVDSGLLMPMDIRCLETDGMNIYAGTTSFSASAKGMFISSNDGAFWTQVTSGISPTAFINTIRSIGNTLLTGISSDVYRSLDSGASWSGFNNGLPIVGAFGVAAFYATTNYVFCGIESGIIGSVFRIDKMSVLPVNEIKKENVTISFYPNPAGKVVTLSLSAWIKGEIVLSIYDNKGRLVRKGTYLNQGKIEIATHNLPAGLYYFHLESGIHTATGKLSVQHSP